MKIYLFILTIFTLIYYLYLLILSKKIYTYTCSIFYLRICAPSLRPMIALKLKESYFYFSLLFHSLVSQNEVTTGQMWPVGYKLNILVWCVDSLSGVQHQSSDRLLVVCQSSSGFSSDQIPQSDGCIVAAWGQQTNKKLNPYKFMIINSENYGAIQFVKKKFKTTRF